MTTIPPDQRAAAEISAVRLIVGMEVHVELRTRSKMFSPAPSPAHTDYHDAPANTLLDPVVLALPGALPTINREAVELAMRVGLALGCQIAEQTKWDRKSYAYPDLPKGYQISQYDLPLCFDGRLDLPGEGERGEPDYTTTSASVSILRAHLEEDAGKLLHEAPGGAPIDHSIVDLNRAGTPLLEIVTQPDITSADQAVLFARTLRDICRFVGATEGVMQRGHIRFEPNINCELTLAGGRIVRTPIVEIKNLNSFRALHAAITHELAEQPRRWREDGRELGPGAKTTRGFDDARGVTIPQRAKEDAEDYRYFPDPDLRPLHVDRAWVDRVRAALPELPRARAARLIEDHALPHADAAQIAAERPLAELYDAAATPESGRAVANVLLQHGARLANERGLAIADLPVSPAQVAEIAALRAADRITAANAGKLLEKLCEPGYEQRDPATVAEYEGWLIVRDDAALDRWVDRVLHANPDIVEQIRAGKQQAIGRLIGEVVRASGGSADAKQARARLLERINP